MCKPISLRIAELGHPVFSEKAEVVTNVNDPVIQTLFINMVETCKSNGCASLAAPQVYKALQMIVLAPQRSLQNRHVPEEMEPMAIINPQLIEASGEKERGWETSPSIPGIRVLVPRYKQIKIHYTDLQGKRKMESFDGYLARLIQQGLNVLNGVVFISLVNPSPENFSTDSEYERNKATEDIE